MLETGLILWSFLRARYGHRFRTRAGLEAWQDQRVQRLLRWVLPRSPFYRRRLEGRRIEDWRSFPVLDKAAMMESFGTFNTAGITAEEAGRVAAKAEAVRDFRPTIGRYTVGLSSGTTGARGLFLVSPGERCAWAGQVLAKALPGSLLEQHRAAFFLRANSNLYTTVERGRLSFRFFDLLRPVEEHLDGLNSFQPTLLIAPPQMLRILAQAREAGSLRLAPRRIISVAESLDPLDEAYLSQAFQTRIHQIYQATEGFIAATCRHGTLHVNEDLLVVQKEYLDQGLGRFLPIITDFSRTTQPIIRYRLNDVLTERTEPCPCGSLFLALERIEGRSEDMLYLPGLGSGDLKPVFADFVSRGIINASEGVGEYRVVQTSPEDLEVYLRPKAGHPVDEGLHKAVRTSLAGVFASLQVRAPRITCKDYEDQPVTRKLRRVESRWRPQ